MNQQESKAPNLEKAGSYKNAIQLIKNAPHENAQFYIEGIYISDLVECGPAENIRIRCSIYEKDALPNLATLNSYFTSVEAVLNVAVDLFRLEEELEEHRPNPCAQCPHRDDVCCQGVR